MGHLVGVLARRAAGVGSYDRALKLWDAASGALLRTFEGHSDQIWSVAFSPGGRQLLSGSRDWLTAMAPLP